MLAHRARLSIYNAWQHVLRRWTCTGRINREAHAYNARNIFVDRRDITSTVPVIISRPASGRASGDRGEPSPPRLADGRRDEVHHVVGDGIWARAQDLIRSAASIDCNHRG